MNILIDTNIIFNIIRASRQQDVIKFINPQNNPIYTSVVSEAEIRSLALRNNWGVGRLNKFYHILEGINVVDINQHYASIYAEIDTYSQKLNPGFGNYSFNTPRNMGKNDLWIASLSALLNLTLVTTDSDFDHLHNVFFEVRKLKPEDFVPFF